MDRMTSQEKAHIAIDGIILALREKLLFHVERRSSATIIIEIPINQGGVRPAVIAERVVLRGE